MENKNLPHLSRRKLLSGLGAIFTGIVGSPDKARAQFLSERSSQEGSVDLDTFIDNGVMTPERRASLGKQVMESFNEIWNEAHNAGTLIPNSNKVVTGSGLNAKFIWKPAEEGEIKGAYEKLIGIKQIKNPNNSIKQFIEVHPTNDGDTLSIDLKLSSPTYTKVTGQTINITDQYVESATEYSDFFDFNDVITVKLDKNGGITLFRVASTFVNVASSIENLGKTTVGDLAHEKILTFVDTENGIEGTPEAKKIGEGIFLSLISNFVALG